MKRFAVLLVVAVLAAAPSEAAMTPEKSLLACQKEAGKQIALYARAMYAGLFRCLDTAEADLLNETTKAGRTCLPKLAKINGETGPNAEGRLHTAIKTACTPFEPAGIVIHGIADVLGEEVGTPMTSAPLNAKGLENICGGLIEIPRHWVDCLRDKVECSIATTVAVGYPNVLELLDWVETQISGMDKDPFARTAAQNVLGNLRAIIDGVPVDGIPDIDCGP